MAARSVTGDTSGLRHQESGAEDNQWEIRRKYPSDLCKTSDLGFCRVARQLRNYGFPFQKSSVLKGRLAL
jgi:hypothetical protein